MDNQEERRMLARAVAAATDALQRQDGTIMLDNPHYAVVVGDPATGRSWGYRRVKDLAGRLESLDLLEAQLNRLYDAAFKACEACAHRAGHDGRVPCDTCSTLRQVMADIAASGVRNGPDA